MIKSFTAERMQVQVFTSRKAMGDAAGKAVEAKILELLAQQAEIRIIFAAAPSQNEVLDYLRQSTRIPWNKITAFHMDEYIGLPSEAPQLFANFLKTHLFDRVNFKSVHLIAGNKDLDAECKRYAALISEKPIDIVCLGIGENGHIAFNDPPVANFNDPEIIKVVDLDHACRQQQVNDGCFAALDEVPKKALTLTIPTLMQGNHLFCVVPGKSKREAVAKTIHQEISTLCPATILKNHSHCSLFLDIESFGEIY
ncbi:glucosamine-6-phosphate deaminase [Catalinimonas niigatensis]|uniref:glucosamine-6-phosphate deaminase n=1 Tax=Catalinimonas niigatensis TaxID=1397264 RepID=UPI002AA2A347|nr:glucosamine-6-phosphate deaminase [Catalinimonas niigatensis]WPP50965.1 glucosamine-6-phosphate deaminase [Catalinimonas niigatensis]